MLVRSCDPESQTAVDDREGDQNTPEPEMGVRPDCPTSMLLPEDVMREAENWLEEDEAEDHETYDGMACHELSFVSTLHLHQCFVAHYSGADLIQLKGKLDPDSDACDEQHIGEDLRDGVDPDG